MKNNLIKMLGVIFVVLFLAYCNDSSEDITTVKMDVKASKDNLVEKGRYLSTIIGCDHCHTPKKMTPNGPVPDEDRWMMGYPSDQPLPEIDKSEITPGKWALFNGELTAAVGPWGISYAANLTPHETGIGTWTFEQFKKSITEGKHKGLDNGRPVMPPMPWQSYRLMKENDLKAIFEYLKSIKPIENVVPGYTPPTEI